MKNELESLQCSPIQDKQRCSLWFELPSIPASSISMSLMTNQPNFLHLNKKKSSHTNIFVEIS